MRTLVTVHAIAINQKNEILVLRRASHRSDPGTWNCVTGYIQDKESAEEAALRELKEETNLTGEILKTTEPFWVDVGDIRWVVISSLIKVDNTSSLELDSSESDEFRWISINDPIVQGSDGLKASLIKLGINNF